MNRFAFSVDRCAPVVRARRQRRAGFTLVEVLVAAAVALLVMAAASQIFARLGSTVSDARAVIELDEQFRAARSRLQSDLLGATAAGQLPPLDPADDLGYFEIIEGPSGPIVSTLTDQTAVSPPIAAINDQDLDGFPGPDPDLTYGDTDDVLCFTTRALGQPFTGRSGFGVVEADAAEVCWFVRGRELIRRTLLVRPGTPIGAPPPGVGIYEAFEISLRQEGGAFDPSPTATPVRLLANTLGDLTKRENRYGHQPYAYPHDARYWGRLGMPTIHESSHPEWPFPLNDPLPAGSATAVTPGGVVIIPANCTAAGAGLGPGLTLRPAEVFDAWNNPHPWAEIDVVEGNLTDGSATDRYHGARSMEDAILNNVIGFDVRVWDPGAPVFQVFGPGLPGTAGGSAIVTVQPGEAGFLTLLNQFILNPTGFEITPPTSANPLSLVSFGAYVDLNYMCLTGSLPGIGYLPALQNWQASKGVFGVPFPQFAGPGDPFSALAGQAPMGIPAAGAAAAVYDTHSLHYERDGLNQDGDGLADEGFDGLDNDWTGAVNANTNTLSAGNGAGGVDDATEREAPPPYATPLRGIQIRIRTFEPSSRKIREFTIAQDFLPQ